MSFFFRAHNTPFWWSAFPDTRLLRLMKFVLPYRGCTDHIFSVSGLGKTCTLAEFTVPVHDRDHSLSFSSQTKTVFPVLATAADRLFDFLILTTPPIVYILIHP